MKALEYANAFKKLKDDPLGFIGDLLTTVIVNIFAPFPLPSAVVAQFKVPLIGFVASLAILFFFMIMIGWHAFYVTTYCKLWLLESIY